MHNHFDDRERAQNYNKRGNIVELGKHLASYIAEHETCENAHILDFGCGTGLVGIPLLAHCKKLSFLDPSEPMLEILRESLEKQPQKNYDVTHGAIFDYKGDDDLDIVIAQLVIHHVSDQVEVLREILKHMKPGGRIYVVEFMPSEVRKSAWTEEQFRAMFEQAGFREFKQHDWMPMHVAFPPSTVETDHPLCMIRALK